MLSSKRGIPVAVPLPFTTGKTTTTSRCGHTRDRARPPCAHHAHLPDLHPSCLSFTLSGERMEYTCDKVTVVRDGALHGPIHDMAPRKYSHPTTHNQRAGEKKTCKLDSPAAVGYLPIPRPVSAATTYGLQHTLGCFPPFRGLKPHATPVPEFENTRITMGGETVVLAQDMQRPIREV